MTCPHCVGSRRLFDRCKARRDLRRYRHKGPTAPTRILLDALIEAGVRGRTVMDIGGGVGAVQHELLVRGAERVINVDASAARAGFLYAFVAPREIRLVRAGLAAVNLFLRFVPPPVAS